MSDTPLILVPLQPDQLAALAAFLVGALKANAPVESHDLAGAASMIYTMAERWDNPEARAAMSELEIDEDSPEEAAENVGAVVNALVEGLQAEGGGIAIPLDIDTLLGLLGAMVEDAGGAEEVARAQGVIGDALIADRKAFLGAGGFGAFLLGVHLLTDLGIPPPLIGGVAAAHSERLRSNDKLNAIKASLKSVTTPGES